MNKLTNQQLVSNIKSTGLDVLTMQKSGTKICFNSFCPLEERNKNPTYSVCSTLRFGVTQDHVSIFLSQLKASCVVARELVFQSAVIPSGGVRTPQGDVVAAVVHPRVWWVSFNKTCCCNVTCKFFFFKLMKLRKRKMKEKEKEMEKSCTIHNNGI